MDIKIMSEPTGIFTSYRVDVIQIEGKHLEILSKILKVIDEHNKKAMENA